MTTSFIRSLRLVFSLYFAGCFTVFSQTRSAPDFGDSITWSDKGESPSFLNLEGKLVLVVFFQSWCGICNGWPGDLSDSFGSSPQGKAAREAVNAQQRQPWIRDEKEAHKSYQSIMKRAARADSEKDRERIQKSLKKLAEKFPATYYGRLAGSNELERGSSSGF